jgi:predicted nucleic acid binding AN1-type Zn finger protein
VTAICVARVSILKISSKLFADCCDINNYFCCLATFPIF